MTSLAGLLPGEGGHHYAEYRDLDKAPAAPENASAGAAPRR